MLHVYNKQTLTCHTSKLSTVFQMCIKQPELLRPVTSTVSTKLHYLGTWATKILKRATTQESACIKDSDDLIKHLKALGTIEKNEHLFITDVVAMYPNIDAEEGLAVLLISCEINLVKYTRNIQKKQLIKVLRVLMKHSVFRFGNTYCRHIDETAI